MPYDEPLDENPNGGKALAMFLGFVALLFVSYLIYSMVADPAPKKDYSDVKRTDVNGPALKELE